MKVSLNTIRHYIDFELPEVSELVQRINAQLGTVEQVTDLGAKYQDALIVRVVRSEKHPNADRLTVTSIDDGGVCEDIERDGDNYIQVVCGAPNVHADMWAVWLPPKSVVPSSFGDADPFVLDSRELRGVISHGMLAAADELALGNDHDGIIEITDRDLAGERDIRAGQSFAETFELNDTVIDIENKMFTHRPDCFGQLGVAREISAIIKGLPNSTEAVADTRFVNPAWYWMHPEFEVGEGIALSVHNDIVEKVPRFMSVAMDGVTIAPSPLWLQCKLIALGGKPVNNVVDITNYVMLLTAQPTHAYDYDKLRGGVLGTRMAQSGEVITLLNGKTYELTDEDIVIVDGDGPIGLAGIMGGKGSEVSEQTTRIVLEVATFDMYTLRKSSMRHGVFTDALTRFNKGQSRLQNDPILGKLIEMFRDIAGARQASTVYDLPVSSGDLVRDSLHGEIKVSAQFINQRLGTELTVLQIGNLLRRVNFASYPPEDDDGALLITAPFWRTDIELAEDIVEEVGRLYGFDALPRELPMRSMLPAPINKRRLVKQQIRNSLSRAGANEVLTYSFIHENVMKRSEQDIDQAFRLGNALSPDLQYYRLTVLPSLLDKVHMNIKAGHDEYTMFEIGKGHNKKYHLDDDEGLPSESNFVDAVYASKQPRDGSAYFVIRRLVDELSSDLGFKVCYKPVDKPLDFPVTAPFDLERSALIETTEGTFIGMVGELKQSVLGAFKLPTYTSAMTLDLTGIEAASETRPQLYRPLSKFPSISQDISLRVDTGTNFAQVFKTVNDVLESSEIEFSTEPVAIYQAQDESNYKTVTLRLTATSHEKTLTDQDVNSYLEAVVESVKSKFNGERI